MDGISRSRGWDKEIPHGVLPMEQLVLSSKWARKWDSYIENTIQIWQTSISSTILRYNSDLRPKIESMLEKRHGPKVKKYFMLNSAKHEIANGYIN